MPNFRIIPWNIHDQATLASSGSPGADFLPENSQNTIKGSVYRVVGATATLTGVLAADRSVTFFGLFKHLSSGGDVQVELFSDAGLSVSVFDSGPVTVDMASTDVYDWGELDNDPLRGSKPFWIWFDDEYTIRSYRLTFNAPSVIQASRIWLGKHFESFINPAWGALLGFGSDTTGSRSRGGSFRTNRGSRWKSATFDFEWIPEDDRSTWLDIMERCGLDYDVVVSLFPEDDSRMERDNVMNGKFTSIDPINRASYAYLSKKIQLAEC